VLRELLLWNRRRYGKRLRRNGRGFQSGHWGSQSGHLETVTVEQLHLICRFVHYQKFRTAGAADESAEFIDGLAKRIMAKDSRVSEDMLTKVKIGPEKPQRENSLSRGGS